LAPFDPSKGLTKLKSWDEMPSEAEAKEIRPLLTRILELTNAAKKELNGTQLVVFFLQCCTQPLQAQISKLWAYTGTTDLLEYH
jgi:hypothetical protein